MTYQDTQYYAPPPSPYQENLLIAVDDQHSKPQLAKVQRIQECRMFSLKWNIYIVPLL